MIAKETATVYRAPSGRRYFTKAAATQDSIRHRVKAHLKQHGRTCECEDEDYFSNYPGYTCHLCKTDWFRRLVDRYTRFLKYLRRKERP